MNIYRENGALCDIFMCNILRHSCFMFKYCTTESSEITAWQTRTSLRKHDVIKVCSIEYLTAQIELPVVLPTFKSRTVHKIIEYLTLDYRLAFEISNNTTAYLFDPPCSPAVNRLAGKYSTRRIVVR